MNTMQTIGKSIVQELGQTMGKIAEAQAEALINAMLAAQRIFVAGAGRSGLMVRAFAMRLMHLGFETHVVGETTTPSLCAADFLLIASGSGATGSLVVMAQKAQKIGAKIGLVTIDPQSPIAQLAAMVLTIPAPSPKVAQATGFRSIQPMGSLFEQCLLLTLDALIMLLMERCGKTADVMFGRHANLE